MNRAPFGLWSENFLLHSGSAIRLYHDFASALPIIDYHNHLSPKGIAENHQFDNLTELWLEGDHYKWRAMRMHGEEERFCTGDAPPEEKFMAWARTVPATIRNPLFHWSALELSRYFGVEEVIDEHNAMRVYRIAGQMLHSGSFRTRDLLSKMNLEILCTTDDPADSLEYHVDYATVKSGFKMYPTFRPDKVYRCDDVVLYNNYIDSLGAAAGISLLQWDDLLQALKSRVEYFHQRGCRTSDHGLESIYYDEQSELLAPGIFNRLRKHIAVSDTERNQLQCALLVQLSRLYDQKGWVQQFHLGAFRNTNTKMKMKIGADIGFDSIGDFPQAKGMAGFFDKLSMLGTLPQTIIYNLNPADNDVFASMAGNFCVNTQPGHMQWGAAWWFNDQKDGMEKQINTLSSLGLLSHFVGMVTDSRSLLSFPRHEYFRRILCNLLGNEMERGELPDDMDLIGNLVRNVCYDNARKYFKWQHQ